MKVQIFKVIEDSQYKVKGTFLPDTFDVPFPYCEYLTINNPDTFNGNVSGFVSFLQSFF